MPEQWRLLAMLATVISLVMVAGMLSVDLSSAAGVSAMIVLSVRCAVPLLYLVFAASSLHLLWPTSASRWLLHNRKFLGLSFAAAMTWQALFILWLVTVHHHYYVEQVYFLRDVIEGVVGYGFLIAMTVTSFRPGRQALTTQQWRVLHKLGIYALWVYAFSVYWWEVAYYPGPDAIDYVYYLMGLAAIGLRITAWARRRASRFEPLEGAIARVPAMLAGAAMLAAGLLLAATGRDWYPLAERLLSGHAATRPAELYLPYWPFEPFFPVFAIALGALLLTRTRRPASPRRL